MTQSDTTPLPLAGLRVLAVEQYGAGPFGTQLLADLGAEVIKVENRVLGGDYARALGPHFVPGKLGDDASLFFQSINRNKRSLALDITAPEGREVFLRLVQGADAVANNLRGDVPERLGLTYDALRSGNPAIVCAHCSAYGREGPRRDWPGYDFLMQAETGFFHLSGEPDTPPTRMGLSVVDFMAGTYMALGLLAAVIGARSTGQGRDVDVNLFDAALSLQSYLATWTLNTNYVPERVSRSAHASMVPCQLYRTADGWIFIMCNKEKFWTALCQEIDRPELADAPDFADFVVRLKHRDALTRILDEALSTRTTGDWLASFAGKVPAAPVRNPREALTDPQLMAGKIETVAMRSGGPGFRSVRAPIRAGAAPPARACPPLGGDTMDILRKAGLSEEQIAVLTDAGVI
jgi:crotonobetainyl-CoA:carnitine CoA-transferase CaiB-like acyl-CoA transferase